MERRNVIGGGLAAGLSGIVGVGGSEAAAAQRDDDGVGQRLENLYKLLERHFDASEPGLSRDVAQLRQQQRVFLRANHKYPDFIEVGADVWESVYNWHVKHLQRIEAARLADGRYTITFMFTNVLMRPDVAPNFVGVPFDAGPAL